MRVTTLTRKEAAALLYISDSTLLRRTKAGRYTATRSGEGQFAKLSYTHESLGLPEPEPEPVAAVAVEPVPEPPAAPGSTVTPPEPEPEDVIWIQSLDPSKDVGFSGVVEGRTAEQRATAFRLKVAAHRRRH